MKKIGDHSLPGSGIETCDKTIWMYDKQKASKYEMLLRNHMLGIMPSTIVSPITSTKIDDPELRQVEFFSIIQVQNKF